MLNIQYSIMNPYLCEALLLGGSTVCFKKSNNWPGFSSGIGFACVAHFNDSNSYHLSKQITH